MDYELRDHLSPARCAAVRPEQWAEAGTDPRILFSWYAADFTTDPDLAMRYQNASQPIDGDLGR